MKALFLLQSIICTVALSVLSIVYASGNFSFEKREDINTESNKSITGQEEESLLLPIDRADRVDEMIKALVTERELLQKKTESMDEKDAKYQQQHELTLALKQELSNIQTTLQANLIEVKKTEEANMKHLAEVYSKMEPESAGKLLKEMDDITAAKILNMIEIRQAAGILTAVIADGDGAVRAALWSDMIQKIKKKSKKEA